MAEFDYLPQTMADSPQVPPRLVRREFDAWGFDSNWIGERPIDLGEQFAREKTFYRYQYDVQYRYKERISGNEFVYPPVEFRTYVYWVGKPPADLLAHFQQVAQPHLQELFNSGPYGNDSRGGHMTGYHFADKEITKDEYEEVAADEANRLGIPQFEVNIRAHATARESASIVGQAGGLFDPFVLAESIPDNEVWKVTKNDARGVYEFRPQGRARDRLEDTEKQVYLDGRYIGQTSPSRGTVELKRSYTSNDQTWKNTETGNQMWSRRKFLNEDIQSSQAIRKDGQVYKANEDENHIILVSTKAQTPDEFDPTPETALPEDATELMHLTLNEDCTEFYIQTDEGPRMGRYPVPTTETVCDKAALLRT